MPAVADWQRNVEAVWEFWKPAVATQLTKLELLASSITTVGITAITTAF